MAKKNLIHVNTVDVLAGIISAMNRTVTITASVDDSGNFQLTVDCLYWLTPVCTYEINGNTYTVQSIDSCNSLTVTGTNGGEPLPNVGDTISLPAPFFWHGTVRATQIEWDNIREEVLIFPAFYAVEPITETFNNEKGTRFDRTSDINLFALVTCNFEDWYTEEHYNNAINPMRRMIAELKEELENNRGIGDFNSFSIVNHANIGVQSANKGATSQTSNFRVSGSEFNVSLPLKRDLVCQYACES